MGPDQQSPEAIVPMARTWRSCSVESGRRLYNRRDRDFALVGSFTLYFCDSLVNPLFLLALLITFPPYIEQSGGRISLRHVGLSKRRGEQRRFRKRRFPVPECCYSSGVLRSLPFVYWYEGVEYRVSVRCGDGLLLVGAIRCGQLEPEASLC